MLQPQVDENRYAPSDVLVVGGGMAGIGAAIAAARQGAATRLIEKHGWLGGIGITGATGLHSFFNIFDAEPDAPRMRTVAGIAQELVDECERLNGGVGHVRMERGGDFVSMVTPVEPETFKAAAANMARDAGVELLLGTVAEGVRANSGHIEGVEIWNKGGRALLRADQYVDCSGDGDIAAWAGAPCKHFAADDPGAYAAGFTFRLCNIDLEALEEDLERRGFITQLAHATKPYTTEPDLVRLGINMTKLRADGETRAPGYFLSSSLRPRELTYCNCINYGPNDGLDVAALTTAEIELRSRMLEIADVFRETFAGCEGCYPAGAAPAVGQRRARAVRCEYELTQDDCTEGRQFDDQIGCFGFIDNADFVVKDAGAYGIPYRALLPREIDNLLIAGRMMTVALVAHNSTRNTACCLVCGQAAGTAAALAARESKRPGDIDVTKLRELLRENDVLLELIHDPVPGGG